MAKVRATKVGYYDHRIIREGDVLDIKEVDRNGVYVDSKGKPILFTDDGKVSKDGKGATRKCKWVVHVDSEAGRPLDPKEVAKVLSGKNPGLPGSPADGGPDAKE